jgi:hypothetical protein
VNMLITASSVTVVRVVSSSPGWLTPVIAVLGLVLALLSLGWQVIAFTRSGSRVGVTMRAGLWGPAGLVQLAEGAFPSAEDLARLGSEGFQTPVLIATITNSGRLPVTIQQCSWGTKSCEITPTRHIAGDPFSRRLDVHDQCTAVVDRSVSAVLGANSDVLKDHSRDVWPVVELGNGRKPVKGKPMRVPEGSARPAAGT